MNASRFIALLVLSSSLFLVGCGFETLPLAPDSERPSFITEVIGTSTPTRVLFRFSDWGQQAHVVINYLDAKGDERKKEVDISTYEPVRSERWSPQDPFYLTIAGHREMFRGVPNTTPRQIGFTGRHWGRV
ncbi:MAG: hypothetical protein HY343_02395 [Lentisphaerae bacterium]|nr:hypothetical protein [Lentisphaerota bacterium]